MISKLLYIFALGLLLSSVASFLLNQFTQFLTLRNEFIKQAEHDIYFLHTICLNDDTLRAIGAVNSQSCQEAEKRLELSAHMKAFQEVLNNIHLCGSYPCTSYINEVIQIILFDWKVVIFLGLVVPFIARILFSRRKKPESIYHVNGGIPFSALPFEKQYYISTNK